MLCLQTPIVVLDYGAFITAPAFTYVFVQISSYFLSLYLSLSVSPSLLLSVCIYIQSWPKRLTHYDFWKIIAFGSKNGFKMGDQCYHMLEEVPLNISRSVPNHWPNSALCSIHSKSSRHRRVEIPLFFLFGINLRVGLLIFVLAIHKLQKCRIWDALISIEKNCEFLYNSMINVYIYILTIYG